MQKLLKGNKNKLLSKISLKNEQKPNIVDYLKHNQNIFKRSLSKNQESYSSKIN
jgi:hypothetical protein